MVSIIFLKASHLPNVEREYRNTVLFMSTSYVSLPMLIFTVNALVV